MLLPGPLLSAAHARRPRGTRGCDASSDQLVAFVELAIQHLRNFSHGMVGDSGANSDRLESFVWKELPDHGDINPRSSLLSGSRSSTAALAAIGLRAPLFGGGSGVSRPCRA